MASRGVELIEWVDWTSTIILGVMLLVALINLVAAPRLRRFANAESRPRTSILIPARDEEHNLRRHLPRLLLDPDPSLEILVLDDDSTDRTAEVVATLSLKDSRLKLLRGAPLPAGWLGKNWACHQLADEASGVHLIFCDADVEPSPAAISATTSALHDYGAVTALPRHSDSGFLASAVVPLVTHLPVIALLPLALVPRSAAPAISMGNGQWLAFRRGTYARIGGHEAVRAEVLEDVLLARRVKSAGDSLLVALAADLLKVRMYDDAAALVRGFGKNLYPLLGGTPVKLMIAALIFYLAGIHPWLGPLIGTSNWAPLYLLVAIRACEVALTGTPLRSILLHPVGAVAALAISFRSAWITHSRSVIWSGRQVSR